MAIETVGQQKYADLTAKRIKSLQTGMIIWISLFCLALICSFSNNLLSNHCGNCCGSLCSGQYKGKVKHSTVN